jgi:hypothetical protein
MVSIEDEMEDLAVEYSKTRGSKSIVITPKMLEADPYFNWDWISVSRDIDLSSGVFERHPDLNWVFQFLCINSTLDLKYLKMFPHKPWDIWGIMGNYPIEELAKHIDLNLHWPVFLKRAIRSESDFFKYVPKDVVIEKAIFDGLTVKIIESYPNITWDWSKIACRYVSLDVIIKYQEKEWTWEYFREDIDIETILALRNAPLCWDRISLYANIQPEDVCKNQNLPWFWGVFSRRDKVWFKELVSKLPTRNWNLKDMEWDIDLFLQTPHCNWTLYNIVDIPYKVLCKYPKQNWGWGAICRKDALKIYKFLEKYEQDTDVIYRIIDYMGKNAIDMIRDFKFYKKKILIVNSNRIKNIYLNSVVDIKRSAGKKIIYRNF